MSVVVRKPRALAIGDPGRAFLDDVVAGLLAEPKRLPPKYFYDQIGSELFQRITALPSRRDENPHLLLYCRLSHVLLQTPRPNGAIHDDIF